MSSTSKCGCWLVFAAVNLLPYTVVSFFLRTQGRSSLILPITTLHPLQLPLLVDRYVTSLSDTSEDNDLVEQDNSDSSTWMERSIAGDDSVTKEVDPQRVNNYDLGISGRSFATGLLSKRMYEAMIDRSSFNTQDEAIRRTLKMYTMNFTIIEAVKAALKQNGLQMECISGEERDEGLWDNIESVRIIGENGKNDDVTNIFDSWEDAVDDWEPGQTFDFVVRKIPASVQELTLDQLLTALDPDGILTDQAKAAGMTLPILGDEIVSLQQMTQENQRRCNEAPRTIYDPPDVDNDIDDTSSCLYEKYRIIPEQDLRPTIVNNTVVMRTMDALVSHACLIVDISNSGATMSAALMLAKMWNATEDFFENVACLDKNDSSIPPLETATETGSSYAKVGYASYDNGSLQFLETRLHRQDGTLLPHNTVQDEAALVSAMSLIANVSMNVVRLSVAAASQEAQALSNERAIESAQKLANELLDNGQPLVVAKNDENGSDFAHYDESTVSMSPHRLCRYVNNDAATDGSTEIFGAHTDSTFITAVPVASVAGLEVVDEATGEWYRPELAARRHWRALRISQGDDPNAFTEYMDDGNGEQVEIPWYSRYIALMPGELLQLATRNEVLAAVHRVVASNSIPRLSAPLLLRGRPGIPWDCDRYLGGTNNERLLEECNGMTTREIHDAMQQQSYHQ